jgi:putative restriction endonuclease
LYKGLRGINCKKAKGHSMMKIDVLNEIDKLYLHKNKKDGIALKKPLLLLLLISQIQNETDNDNKFFFKDLEQPLDNLIRSFGGRKTSKGGKPEQPFHHLNSSPIWDLFIYDDIQYNNSVTLSKKILRESSNYGYFNPEVYTLLKNNINARKRITKFILNKFWPETVQEDIVNYLMLDVEFVKRNRNHLYANKVLTNYRYKCAMCGFTGLFNESPFGLDAAHIKWHAYGGPDEMCNGIALCKLHHWAFDRGALTILKNTLEVIVSARFIAQDPVSLNLLEQIHGNKIDSYKLEAPSNEFLEWHYDNIFIT